MTPEEISAALKSELVDSNLSTYRKLFQNTRRADVADPYWNRALALFDRLKPEDQVVLFEIIRQVEIDTVSNFLGVLDGSSSLPGVDKKFHLSIESNASEKLNGTLQDSFLQIVEAENT